MTPEIRLSDKPPFDAVRAAFYLVAGVIAVYCIMALTAVVHCWWNYEQIAKLTEGGGCDAKGRFFDLLSAALAAALALYAGMTRKP
jgi:hypothetical protein